MDERRVADYFVVVGLPENPLPLAEYANEAVLKPTYKQDPITDIAVINKTLGEKVPKGYTCVERTQNGFQADLNHGSLRCHELYLCYRRSRDKSPLTDVGVLFEGKERLMSECEVVHTTPWGNPANVNNSNNGRTYITFRRARETAASDTLAVVEVCIILGNKNEIPPHAYHRIDKNLNRGMVGSDVYLCYKKAMTKADLLAYQPAILDRYPEEDHVAFPLPDSLPMFCLPMGACIECWSAKAQHPLPVFSTFVLTGSAGEKLYGAAVTFYEEYPEENLTDLQMRHLGLKNKHIREQYRILKTVHAHKSICLLSHWPFFDAFRKFLTYLYRISITGPHPVPIERHISHFMFDVPYPSPQRPRILVQLSHEALCLSMPEDSPLPQNGSSYITMLKNLGPENCMSLLLHVLHEQKILIHSLRPAVLTGVAEAVASMLFPLHWQCAYIPLCPLGLSYVLSAPVPFIVGVDSRFFDLYDPPSDVVCVDLDTITISLPEDKKNVSYKQLPKKPAKVLMMTLHKLFDDLCAGHGHQHTIDEVSLEMAPIDHDFKRKRKETLMELQIQEAFLRFMACVLKGYRQYLKPILNAPNAATTDVTSLFDMQAFLKSRDKANSKFYQALTKTQSFISFIEARSFVSDMDASLAFFDECAEKVEETKDEPKLIELDDSQNSERTKFILPPEPVGLPEGVKYSYNGFPKLKHELFLRKNVSELSLPSKGPLCPNSPISRRTKQEVRTAIKIAQTNSSDPMLWAKCLLSYCYSLWFIHLPAFVSSSPSKSQALKTAYDVLQKMQLAKLKPPDEVCYRVMLQLCGQYNMPVLAVKVHSQMKIAGVHPNAITYGYYNKAVFEGTWPSSRSRGAVLWKKVRNVIIGVAQFRRALRRRSLSLCSNSGSEYDQISRTSIDSFLEDHTSHEKQGILKTEIVSSAMVVNSESAEQNTPGVNEESSSTGAVSDSNSLNQEEGKSVLQSVAETSEENEHPVDKVKKEAKGNLRFTLPQRHRRKDKEGDNGKKDLNFPAYDNDSSQFRSRVGSIVRKSLGSVSSSGSHDTLKGSAVNLFSAGLIMVNENYLNSDSQIPPRLQHQQSVPDGNKRKRHKSAGDHKPRSNSVCNNWRPRHVSGEDSLLLRFSDFTEQKDMHIDEDDIFSLELDKPSKIEEEGSNSALSKKSDDTKDSGVVLDEMKGAIVDMNTEEHSSGERPVSVPINMQSSALSSSVSAPESFDYIPQHSIGTPVTKDDPLGFFNRDETKAEISEVPTTGPSVTFASELLDKKNTDNSETRSIGGEIFYTDIEAERSEKPPSQCNNSRPRLSTKDALSLGSAHSLDACSTSSGSQPLSPVERIGKKLMDFGRTNSTPALDEKSGSKSSFWNMKGYLSSPLKKSTDSLDDKSGKDFEPGTPSESRLRKLGSLRKHNERLSGALKFAAGALATKFSEFKQTMSTPSKTGSNSSLQHTGDGDSINSEEGYARHHRGVDVPTRKTGSFERRKGPEDAVDRHLKQLQNGVGSMPSSSFIEQYIPLKEFGEQKNVQFASLVNTMQDIAIETEISSCCRCGHCRSLLYDEEIMSGWLADDSNLNAICIFCTARLVPRLQIYVKDWREKKTNGLADIGSNSDDDEDLNRSGVSNPDGDTESIQSSQDPWVLQEGAQQSSWDNNSGFLFGEENLDGELCVPSLNVSVSPQKDRHLAEAAGVSPSGSMSMSDIAVASRRRCASECLTSATEYMYGSSFDSTDNYQSGLLRSPFSLSIDENGELPTRPSAFPEMKKDFMERGTTTLDPITVPYLSPLVLRKELENILSSEGDMSVCVDTFLDEHPIIFWNLVWYFKRIGVPSHLPGFLLTAKSVNVSHNQVNNYDSHHVLIRPMWDNIRIHEEAGLPMCKLWNDGHSSHTVDALVTEAQPFNRALLHQIITSIQCNDVLSPIKLVMNCRRRNRLHKHRHRSIYRDVLFLALVACGRENIDIDAFDREYRNAFSNLQPMEVKRTQRNDRPRKTKVIWCRKVFGELEV